MFLPYTVPIVVSLPKNFPYIDIYPIHDLHKDAETFDKRKWKELKDRILKDELAYAVWVGDLMENAVPNSKSDVFTQQHSPAEQKEWVTEQFVHFGTKTLGVVPGNHCRNRTTKLCGLYPLYDACLIAGIGDRYRQNIAFFDIGVGTRADAAHKQVHYFGQMQHKAKDIKTVSSSDYTDGIDFFVFGHDHEPKDRPRAKLVFDQHNKVIRKKNVECINCGSGMAFGGYAADEGMRPQSDKLYKLRLFSGEKKMETTGFYV